MSGRERILLGPPEITADDIRAVSEVLATTRLSRGPAEARFERRVARAVGVDHAVAVSSGTTGLQLALAALGIGPGDEVITSPYSFVASANAILHVGATPVFVDIDAETFALDPAAIDAAVSARTRAVLPVHVYGRPAPMVAIAGLARRHGLVVVEDACEAIGSRIGGRAAGAWGDVAVLSFYPNKQITTGEGGVVVTADAELAERLRLLRNQGRRPSPDGFDQVVLGYSARLPEMSCALGASQIERLEQVVARRAAIVDRYRERLRDIPGLALPVPARNGERISWFAFVVLVPEGLGGHGRDLLVQRLDDDGIEAARYFPPIHLMPLYRERFGYRGGEFPIAESVGERALALPLFHGLTVAQIDRICESLRTHIAAAQREPQKRGSSTDRAAGNRAMDDTFWYFAYGSNLDPDRFRARICHWLEMRPARLVGFRLRFSDDVCSEGGAGAVIIPDAGRSVHGAVFRITRKQMEAMDREEFADEHVGASGATRRTVTVQTDQGPLNAEVYTIHTDSFGPPSAPYLGHITRGLAAVGFGPEVVAEVERVAAAEGD